MLRQHQIIDSEGKGPSGSFAILWEPAQCLSTSHVLPCLHLWCYVTAWCGWKAKTSGIWSLLNFTQQIFAAMKHWQRSQRLFLNGLDESLQLHHQTQKHSPSAIILNSFLSNKHRKLLLFLQRFQQDRKYASSIKSGWSRIALNVKCRKTHISMRNIPVKQ